MKSSLLQFAALMALVAACGMPPAEPSLSSESSASPDTPSGQSAATHTVAPTATSSWPPVEGAEPSDRVAAFYYPWYGNPVVNGAWVHWDEPAFLPPLDISSDYYPVLGAYSSIDPLLVAQHFAWLRAAGVGVIVSSWWGQGSREDRAIPVLLEAGERYGIKVTFHIEPYSGRTATRLVRDVQYIFDHYGDHPAFFRTTASSRWSPDDRPKGVFFVWLIGFPDTTTQPVEADYWLEAMDAIHALPQSALVIADTTETGWVDAGHFDGLYNYATLHLDGVDDFAWAQGLPPDTWYVPSVIPGFSARRIQYAEETYVPRQAGATYDQQWQAALGVGVEPAMVTITSFNEWHEGTQIEPAAVGATDGRGYTYADYGPLPPEGYLARTREWVARFLAATWPATYRVRVRMTTTSDWTTFGPVSGATWQRPSLVSASEEATYAWLERDRLVLTQPLPRAEAAGAVEMVVDLLLTDADAEDTLVFTIERGHLGYTRVEVFNFLGADPVAVEAFVWSGINVDERNTRRVQIPAEVLLSPVP